MDADGNIPVERLTKMGKKTEFESASALPSTLSANTVYKLKGGQSSVAINLPQGQSGDFVQVDFYALENCTLTITSTYGITDVDLTPEAGTIYTLYFDWGLCGINASGVTSDGWRFSYSEYKALTITDIPEAGEDFE